ncbi:hypothetical protein [Benzoatithermus flavus]|uniref:Uncharacterized protein n=1 Tax=Benzoatithermus flavus TaxID=3108223 RepID=A0ABU8XRP4_9PROT
MRPALKAALERLRALLLAAAAGSAPPLPGHAQAPAGTETGASAAEQKVWAEARKKRTVAGYERYLELFPTGQYAEEAFRLLVEHSLKGRPVKALVDVDPPARPGAKGRRHTIETAALSLY